MRRFMSSLAFAAVAIVCICCVAGCYARARGTYGYATTGTIVRTSPPPPRMVAVTAPPFSGAIWSDGYWDWDGGRWIWVDGCWVSPRVGYQYQSPRWQRSGNGWVFDRGGFSRGYQRRPAVRARPYEYNQPSSVPVYVHPH